MKFTSPTNSFELAILGYGNQARNWRDRNHLNCRVSASWQHQPSSDQSAPLRTWEVCRLLGGLQSLLNQTTKYITLTTAESGLSMEVSALSNDTYRVLVQLDHSLTPCWHTYPDFPVEMNMTLSRGQLNQAMQELAGEVAQFPQR
jgi:hypothetical protein